MQLDDARPIWAQLVDEFRRRIVAGDWPVGAKVPSVRELALELGVNPNTVQKALGDVDRLGLTVTERTAGRFVTDDVGAIARARSLLAASAADRFAATAVGVGLALDDAVTLLTSRWPQDGDTPAPTAPGKDDR